MESIVLVACAETQTLHEYRLFLLRQRALDRLAPQSAADIMQAIDTEDLGLEVQAEGTTAAQVAAAQEVDDAPVVRYLQKMMLDAINKGASDIHFEPLREVLPHPLSPGRYPL